MIKQLLKQIWTQRALNAWLWIELVVVFVCLSYLVDYLYTTSVTYFSPKGYNIEHVYEVSLDLIPPDSHAYMENETDSMLRMHLATALERMRAYPGIEAVSVSSQGIPYSQRQANGTRGADSIWIHGWVFRVTPSFFRVFKVADKNGETEPLVEAAMQEWTVIASVEAEKEFAAKGMVALNGELKNENQEESYATIRAITGSFRFDEFQTPYPAFYHCRSEASTLKNDGTEAEYVVRVRPEMDSPAFIEEFRQAMKNQLRMGNLYLLDIMSFEDIRTNYFRANGTINDVKTHIAGLTFLLVNILLGVVGTFWIRTQQRRSEIAVRMAMGASHRKVQSELITEGALLLLSAVIPGMIICGNLVYLEIIGDTNEMPFTLTRFAAGQGLTFVIMLVMIIVGVLFPARQTMRIQPAEALHEE